ncbi:MAG TPA: alkaline phosphatase family protein, partial [Acidobacteriaceae bacterium]
MPTANLQAAKGQITAGESVVLTWKSSNAESVTITPSVSTTALPLSGSATVKPAKTTTYQMTASGTGGSASASVTVSVAAAPPPAPSVTLSASQSTVASGGTVTLTWTSSNATSVSIDPAVGTTTLPLNGSAPVIPGATTTYTITATQGSQTAKASVIVTVLATGTTASPINHLIVVILQNHSFDNLFGTYPGAMGLDPNAPSYKQADASGTIVSPSLLTSLTTADLNHDQVSYTAAYDGG